MTLEELLALDRKRSHPKREEDSIQTECIRVMGLMFPKQAPALIHIPNEGKRKTKLITRNGVSKLVCTEGARLKKMGMKKGASDLILFEKRGEYGGLFIELKTRSGSQSPEQKEWQRIVEERGYKYVICRNVEQFINEVKLYLAFVW